VFTVVPPNYSCQCRGRSWPAQIEGCLAKGKREGASNTTPSSSVFRLEGCLFTTIYASLRDPEMAWNTLRFLFGLVDYSWPSSTFIILEGRLSLVILATSTRQRLARCGKWRSTIVPCFSCLAPVPQIRCEKLGDQMVSVSLASLGNTWQLRAEIFGNGLSSHRRVGCRPSSLISLDLISNQIYHWFFSSSYG